MTMFINKLIALADGLDGLGLKKDADVLDKIIAKAAAGDEFGDYLKLFDEPLELDVEEEKGPGEDKPMLEEPEIHTPLEEEEAPLRMERTPGVIREMVDSGPGPEMRTDKDERMHAIKRRHELLKLKKQLEMAEKAEKADQEMAEVEPNELPVATEEDLESFEDENDADDASLVDFLKEKMKQLPELGKELLTLVKDNPELLELLAL